MKYYLFAFVLLCLSSCDDYLNVQPDTRIEIDTPDKVKQLLVNSYPNANYALVAELSADNFVDNNAPNSKGIYYNLTSFDRMDDQLFAWEDVRSSSGSGDSPYELWEQYFQSIASANAALEAIEKLIQKGVSNDEMEKIILPSKGEAYLIRAYSYFMLVNIFSKTYKDIQTSRLDPGVPLISKPVDEIGVKYERNSVAEVYEFIEQDIEAGIDLIDNVLYDVPKYHFNKNAAHAFAAQFYLFKRKYEKVIEHAHVVLGNDPSNRLRDWVTIYNNSDQQSYAYMNVKEPANLLMLATYSTFFRRFMNYRYGHNGDALNGGIWDGGPTWNNQALFTIGWLWTYKQDYGLFFSKVLEQFEYTDRVAGIGYPHIVRSEFTTDATLLDRAEAYIFTNQIDKAVEDLQTWNKSHRSASRIPNDLTKSTIQSFYVPNRPFFSKPFHTEKLSPQFIVTPEQKPFVDCVLHFRRLERIFEGHRWFDIKRYGIELEHKIDRAGTVIQLSYDDDRRAIQIPSDVIGAGIDPNPRKTVENTPAVTTHYLYK